MPMPRRLVEKIQAGEFVEFAEFPVVEGGSQGGSTPGFRAETQQEGGTRCLPMGQLLHIIRAGSADGGTGQGSGAEHLQGADSEGSPLVSMGACHQIRQTVPESCGGGQEEVLGTCGCISVHAGVGGSSAGNGG